MAKCLNPHDSDFSNDNNFTILANPSVDKMRDEVSETIAKLTTQKKRFSGAQRIKLRSIPGARNIIAKIETIQTLPKIIILPFKPTQVCTR